MPVKVKKFGSKYKVCDPEGKCLSKKPLSLEKAKKQELAVRLSTLRKEGKIPARKNGKGPMIDFMSDVISNTYNEWKKNRKPVDPRVQAELDKIIKSKKIQGKGASSYAVLSNTKIKF
jgi:hypothetical protein